MNLLQNVFKSSLLINLVCIFVCGLGIYASFDMKKEAYPPIELDIIHIITPYPGASALQVELHITNLIEEELKELSGIKKVDSSSVEGKSTVVLELDESLSQRRRDRLIEDLRRAIEGIDEFPPEVDDKPLILISDSSEFFVLELAISAQGTESEVQALAEDLGDDIRKIPDCKNVILRGYREQEIWIEAIPEKLYKYHISIGELVRSLRDQHINLPAGSIDTKKASYLIRTTGSAENLKQIKDTVVRANPHHSILIRDLAKVSWKLKKPQLKFRTNGLNTINMLIQKKSTGDIISLVKQIREATNQFLDKQKTQGLDVKFTNDISIMVENRLSILFNNGLFGFLFVLIVLLLFLSKGIAFVTAVGIPIAFFAALIYMYYNGITINLITMFGMVMVIGMIVDDAIIVAENIWQHYEMGSSPWKAAVDGTMEVIRPVLTTILTTIAAFSPLLTMSGLIGKFISILPMVIIITLIMSLIESMLILPNHAWDFLKLHDYLKTRKSKESPEDKSDDTPKEALVKRIYESILKVCLRFRYLFILSIFGSLAGSVWLAIYKMDFVLFPTDDARSIIVQSELPSNSSLEMTSVKFKKLEEIVKKIPEGNALHYITSVGVHQNNPNDLLSKYGPHLGQIVITLEEDTKRSMSVQDIINFLRPELESVAKAEGFESLSFDKINMGPPVGKPVAVRISGDQLSTLNDISIKVSNYMKTIPEIQDIQSSLMPGKEEIRFIPDKLKVAKSLLTNIQISNHIRTVVDGDIARKITLNEELIPLRVKMSDKNNRLLETLKSSHILNMSGKLVPLDQLASIQKHTGLNQISHKDGIRTATISANISESGTSVSINRKLLPFLKTLSDEYPDFAISAGGEYEDTNESVEGLIKSFIIALTMIFFILVAQFHTLTQPFVVMAAIPFGVIGVILAFFFHGAPLSFLGMIGMIGLSGVVINDSIVLVDFINKARLRHHMSAIEACIYAGKRRFRAVWLTSITTIVGLLPLVYGIGGRDLFLEPAAMAMSYGLLFGTILILLFVPCLYLVREDIIRILSKPFQKKRDIW